MIEVASDGTGRSGAGGGGGVGVNWAGDGGFSACTIFFAGENPLLC